MSYSRWSTSFWYTYWMSLITESDKKDDQMFMIQCISNFTYKELIDDIDKCISKVRKECNELPVKETDFVELKTLMSLFIEDVKNDKELL